MKTYIPKTRTMKEIAKAIVETANTDFSEDDLRKRIHALRTEWSRVRDKLKLKSRKEGKEYVYTNTEICQILKDIQMKKYFEKSGYDYDKIIIEISGVYDTYDEFNCFEDYSKENLVYVEHQKKFIEKAIDTLIRPPYNNFIKDISILRLSSIPEEYEYEYEYEKKWITSEEFEKNYPIHIKNYEKARQIHKDFCKKALSKEELGWDEEPVYLTNNNSWKKFYGNILSELIKEKNELEYEAQRLENEKNRLFEKRKKEIMLEAIFSRYFILNKAKLQKNINDYLDLNYEFTNLMPEPLSKEYNELDRKLNNNKHYYSNKENCDNDEIDEMFQMIKNMCKKIDETEQKVENLYDLIVNRKNNMKKRKSNVQLSK